MHAYIDIHIHTYTYALHTQRLSKTAGPWDVPDLDRCPDLIALVPTNDAFQVGNVYAHACMFIYMYIYMHACMHKHIICARIYKTKLLWCTQVMLSGGWVCMHMHVCTSTFVLYVCT